MQKLNIKNQRFLLIALYFLLSTYFLGCATVPRRPRVRASLILEKKSFRVGSSRYIYLKDLSRSFDLVWDWDVLGKKLQLYGEGIKVSLALGSSIALINGKKTNLASEVRYFNNQLIIPLDLSKKISLLISPPSKRKRAISERIYKIRRIVIDPGHGGRDPGAIGPGGLQEKRVVLEISKDLRRFLEHKGIQVVLTRDRDRFLSLWRRTHIANSKKADLFISIHANSSRWTQARGFEVYYLSEKMDDATRALANAENAVLELEGKSFSNTNTALAATLWDLIQTENRAESIQLANYICNSVRRLGWIKNRGVKGALFYVLKGIRMPGILIETGFISNRSESWRLFNTRYRQELVRAIGEGILAYVREYERTEGFTN